MSFGVIFALHCGTDAGSTFDDACSAMYGARCGAPCNDDVACGDGMHCRSGHCNAACGLGHVCPDGLHCSSEGRCGSGGGFGVGDSSSNFDGGPQADACGDLTLVLGKSVPTVVVLVDRSGSMSDSNFGDSGVSRWTMLKTVLLERNVIESLQSEVRFGLSMYSNPRPNGPCPNIQGVPYAIDNFSAIQSVLASAGTQPDTPTGAAVLAVSGITDAGTYVDGGLATADAGGGEKIILLVTDGDPDSCEDRYANDPPINAADQQKAKDIAVDAVQRAYLAGIKTYVLAIGNDVAGPHQQEMANAGLGYAPDAGAVAPFFRPSDETQLIAQLNNIIMGARSCSFSLNGEVQAGQEASGHVVLNGKTLTYNSPNGWRLLSSNQLEILGTACDEVQTSPSAELTVRFPCGSVDIR